MAKIGFIGVGVMGSSMIKHLVNHSHEVKMFTRTSSKAEKLSKEVNAKVCKTIKETVEDADFVISIVGYPKDVEEVYFDKDGIIENAKKSAVLIDMTTSKPSLAVEIYNKAKEMGIEAIDAPVSGGDKGAREATLSIMVGGSIEGFNKAKEILNLLGKSIHYMGEAGMGQHTKACNQIAVAGATAAYTEAIVYAKKVGLDVDKMFSAISGGAAGSWQINNMAPRALKKDFDPGFFVKHFIKDMRIVREEMDNKNVDLRMLDTVLEMYEQMANLGFEDDGTQALIKIYDEKNS